MALNDNDIQQNVTAGEYGEYGSVLYDDIILCDGRRFLFSEHFTRDSSYIINVIVIIRILYTRA